MKHQHWFKVWQDRLLSDPKFKRLSSDARGILLTAWCFASRCAEMGDTGLSPDELRVEANSHPNAFRVAMPLLRQSGFIDLTETGSVTVRNWIENQETAAASRVRKYRARNSNTPVTVTVTPNVTVEAEAEAEAEADVKGERTPIPPATLPEPPTEPEGDAYAEDDPTTKPKPVNLDMTAIASLTSQLFRRGNGTMSRTQARETIVDLLEFHKSDAIQVAITALPERCTHWDLRNAMNGRTKPVDGNFGQNSEGPCERKAVEMPVVS